MKTKILFFLTILSLLGCTKDDSPQPEPDKLPDATMVGANTAGCYIHGKLIIPKNGINSTSGFPVFGLEYVVGPNFVSSMFNDYFVLKIINLKSQGLSYNIYIQMNSLSNGIGNFIINQSNGLYYSDGPNNPQIIVSEVNGTISTGKRFLSSPASGIMKITRFDYVNKIYSGTFTCTLYNSQNPSETIQVTDGRFDINGFTLNN